MTEPKNGRRRAAEPAGPCVVAVLGRKGGTGNTTVALNLAGAACAAGIPAAVLDLDPQGSASLWADLRRVDEPPVEPIDARDLGRALRSAAGEGAALVVLDTAPHSEGASVSAAAAADLVLVPCGVSLLDVHAAAHTVQLAAPAAATVGVLSLVPPRCRMAGEVREELERCGLPVLASEVGNRIACRYALQDGSLIGRFAPRSKAAAEFCALWREVAGLLGGRLRPAAEA